jgi:putative spermidine/putrescine transport system permease protein
VKPSSSSVVLVAYAWLLFGMLLVPIAIVLVFAFSADASFAFPPRGFSLRWFRYLAERREFLTATSISVQVAIIASVASVCLGTLAALALVRERFVGKDLVEAVLMGPLVLPGIIIGVALLQFMSVIGLTASFWRLVLAHVVVCTPYAIRSIGSSLYNIDPALEQASRVLGAGGWRTFRRVLLPLIRPGMIAAFIFCFITSFDNVAVSIYLISGETVTLPVRILTYVEWQFDPSIAAISTILAVLTTALVIVVEALTGLSRPLRAR